MAYTAEPGAPALKEIFNLARLAHIGDAAAAVYPAFDRQRFLTLAGADLESLGIMQRLRQVATSLQATFPADFHQAAELLERMAPQMNHGFAAMALSDYVALYGQKHPERALQALKLLTRFGSSEFAIRHFLGADLPGTLAVMEAWAGDDNEHVRRLASEGCRPRLPWSFQLKPLIADPAPVAKILDRLRADDSLYVRKSVANHLNDITKDHPDWVLQRLAGWDLSDARSGWIARHALRTLIKKGHRDALAVIGAGAAAEVSVDGFSATPKQVQLGGRLTLACSLTSTAQHQQRLVVDYAIHYVKKAAAPSRKVFKWKELTLAAGETVALSKSQAIRDFTTRIHYSGDHKVELLVNGALLAEDLFILG